MEISKKFLAFSEYMNFPAKGFFHAFQIIVDLKMHKFLEYLFAGNYFKHVFTNRENLKIVHIEEKYFLLAYLILLDDFILYILKKDKIKERNCFPRKAEIALIYYSKFRQD